MLIVRTNLLIEVVICGASQKRPSRDSTLTYSPRGFTFWDAPQIAAYLEKLNLLLEGCRCCSDKEVGMDGIY